MKNIFSFLPACGLVLSPGSWIIVYFIATILVVSTAFAEDLLTKSGNSAAFF
ncbi:MAG: hypothetical protein PHQ47_01200 [Candidatus Portnoybacteria bacterium]|nr:hypothetical protein [Candidatus Portnoybacteria bacterium]